MHHTMHTQYTQNKSHTKYNISHCLLQGTYNNHSKYCELQAQRNHITSNHITLNNTITVESYTQHSTVLNSTQTNYYLDRASQLQQYNTP